MKEKLLPAMYAPIAVLSLGLLPMPYSYYGILRLVVSGSACYLMYNSYKETSKLDEKAIPLIVMALIYNPIFQAHLGRPVWTIINLATIAFFAYRIKQIKKTGV